MRGVLRGLFFWFIAAALTATTSASAQQAPDTFHWVDFHAQSDQSVIVWVTRALQGEKWTAIREIGVEYDAALVVTTLRSSPEAAANEDTFAIWSVSLTDHLVTPLIKGVNLRWTDWLHFAKGAATEPGVLYEDCADCAATTYFTAFHYDISRHAWAARWMSGGQGVPVWRGDPPAGVAWTQVFAVMAAPDGIELVGTWNHLDNVAQKTAEDYVYRYDLDPWSGLERTQHLSGNQAEGMKMRLCRAEDAVPRLARGQDSPLCQQYVKLQINRKPVTTPPANNEGRSVPPGTRR
jgi:hypothetical protein